MSERQRTKHSIIMKLSKNRQTSRLTWMEVRIAETS